MIDGIRDLLSNINDPEKCTDLVTWIEHLTVAYQLHIVNVLHLNKTDNNARGHIGSELLNKAEITIELELDEKAQCTTVKCESAGDVPFPSFAFTHNGNGLPEIVSMPVKGKAISEIEQKKRLEFVFEGQILKYKEVIDGIKTHFDVGENKADLFTWNFYTINWIFKDGTPKSKDSSYKLMVKS